MRVTSLPLFFFNDPATTEIYTLSLHDALPIFQIEDAARGYQDWNLTSASGQKIRSEEHTSELQSQSNLVCRLLLEKKKRERCPRHETPHARGPTTPLRGPRGDRAPRARAQRAL